MPADNSASEIRMTTVDAIFRKGAFQPIGPVELPDECRVRLNIEEVDQTTPEEAQAIQEIHRIMGLRFHSGCRDTAERHNDHQP